MAFLSQHALSQMGFKSLGRDVLISDRAAIYNADRISIGDFSRIDDFCIVSGTVSIGTQVHIAAFCNLAGGTPGITMEDFSGLAYGCHLFAQSDDYSGSSLTNPTIPSKFKTETKLPINIGRHTILGTGSMVFPGVVLPEGVASGARTTFFRSAEAWSIYVGSPARKLRDRSRDLLRLESAFLAERAEATRDA